MDGYSISQVAERTGFPPTTLRYYERSGLVRPGRTTAGYRCYGDTDVERLSFIGRAKSFGLTLDEITELLVLLGDDECAPVQGRLRDLVDVKIADAQAKVAELTAFTVELERVAATLRGHTPDGPCDDSCGCTTDHDPDGDRPVALGRRPHSDPPPIACSLSGDQLADRLDEWRVTVADASGREPIRDGTRLRFARGVDVEAIAALVAAEQACCSFFTFTLTVGPDDIALDVTAPAAARPMIDALVGTA